MSLSNFLLYCTAVLMAGFSLGCESRTFSESDLLTPGQFQDMAREGAIILDVRTPVEISQERISGAVNLNINDPGFSEKMAMLDRDRTYLIYCASGTRSSRAADMMIEKGFQRVFTLEGGIRSWEEQGYPVLR